MKAKEYAKKYEDKFPNDEEVYNLFMELSKEVEEICMTRHVKSNQAFAAVVREINDKWNAIGRLLHQKYRTEYLKKDGFLAFWKNEMPELNQHVK